MNELPTILKARRFLREAGETSVPIDIDNLAEAANARIKVVFDLADEESGQTTSIRGKRLIIVNGNHNEERQRFTVLHEIAHIVLGLPSQHDGPSLKASGLMSYRRRPREEMLCDVFAAECLLPHEPFRKQVGDSEISLDAVKSLAAEYKASLTTTGSRFALHSPEPCAFVLTDNGTVRYVSRSKHLTAMKGWIDVNAPVPDASVARRLIKDHSVNEDFEELATDVWFNGSIRNRPLVAEAAILLRDWNQCLSLIWFDESLKPAHERWDKGEADPSLAELDGKMAWPSKSRRR